MEFYKLALQKYYVIEADHQKFMAENWWSSSSWNERWDSMIPIMTMQYSGFYLSNFDCFEFGWTVRTENKREKKKNWNRETKTFGYLELIAWNHYNILGITSKPFGRYSKKERRTPPNGNSFWESKIFQLFIVANKEEEKKWTQ